MRGIITRMMQWILSLGRLKLALGAVGVLVLGVVGVHFLTTSSPADVAQVHTPSVDVKSVAELSADAVPLSVAGTVTSRSEATVRTQKSGQITRLYRALGDSVGAGSVVAEFEDASERAALLQAQGAVDAAQANLDKVQKGTRTEQLAILQAALDGARSGAVNTLLSAYASVDNAIHGTTDAFFSNPEGTVPHFNIPTSNSQLRTTVENERGTLRPILTREASKNNSLSAVDDLTVELTNTETEVRSIRDFLDDIVATLNVAIPDPNTYSAATIATYLSNTATARTSMSTTLSAIASARQALQTAQKNEEQGITGAQPEDIAGAQAALTQAQGSLAAARANLEKSIIRAPISGTINSLSLKTGDYVNVSTPVLTVANNGALEVLAYVTEGDARVSPQVLTEERPALSPR